LSEIVYPLLGLALLIVVMRLFNGRWPWEM
jgi:hypothetical protein